MKKLGNSARQITRETVVLSAIQLNGFDDALDRAEKPCVSLNDVEPTF